MIPNGERKYLVVGSKAWNERYLAYEWNGHEFGDKRSRPLPEFMNTVEKRREARRNKAFERFDRKVAEGRLSDVVYSTLGYALTYYHTVQGDMYKEWVKENFNDFDYTLVEGNPIAGYGSHYDMQLMSLCRHNILSNSTYSWWGAFLNRNPDKTVVLPDIWFNPESCQEYTSKPVRCEGWIAL